MKIGIITIQDSKNYGACLQSYALQRYLNEQTIVSAELIDLRRKEHFDYKTSRKFKIISFSEKFYNKTKLTFIDKFHILIRRCCKKVLLFLPNMYRKSVFKKRFHQEIKNRNFKFYVFFRRADCSDRFFCIDDLYSNPPSYDLFVVGSDQVWNPYNNYNVKPYLLTFTDNANKYTYASSIGTSKISQKLLEEYAKELKKFKRVSVREEDARELLEKRGVQNIRVDLDPTFLISPKEWAELSSGKIVKENYIFWFALTFTKDFFEIAERVSTELNLPLVCIAKDENDFFFLKDKNIKFYVDIGIEDWLSLIKYSSLVITDSFHGTVFSMFLSQKYYTYIAPSNTKGQRIKNLLQTLAAE